jgi:hypothetical protein
VKGEKLISRGAFLCIAGWLGCDRYILLQSETRLKSKKEPVVLFYKVAVDGNVCEKRKTKEEREMRKPFLWVLGFWLGAGTVFAQQKISLEDYLGQVKAKGPGYQSAQASVEGLVKQSHQQDLTYSPQLLAGYNHTDDQSMQSTFLSTTHTLSDSAGVSLMDKFPF